MDDRTLPERVAALEAKANSFDERLKYFEDRLNKIDNKLFWTLITVVGALLTSIINLVVKLVGG